MWFPKYEDCTVKRIYGFADGFYSHELILVSALAEDGQLLARAVVKDEQEGKEALGFSGLSENNWPIYRKKYHRAYLEWVNFKITNNHKGLARAIKRNRMLSFELT
jgi:hypothetical protein